MFEPQRDSSKKNEKVTYDLSKTGDISKQAQRKANTMKKLRLNPINDNEL